MQVLHLRNRDCDKLDHLSTGNINLVKVATKNQIAPAKTYKEGHLKTLITEGIDISLLRLWPRFNYADRKLDPRPKLLLDVTYTVKTTWKTGIQRVVRNIAKSLTDKNFSNDKFESVLCFSDGQKHFIRATIADNLAITVDRWRGVRIRHYSRGDRIFMLDSSLEFYKTQHKILRKAQLAGAQVFSCLYDMVPLRVPALCHPGAPIAYTPWFESALSISDGFVCISRAVADELLELLKAIKFPRKMKVGHWPLGADIGLAANTPRHQKTEDSNLPKFLIVGTIEPRKNHLLALEAFTELWNQGYQGTLTLLGRRGWSDEQIVQAIEKNPEFGRKLKWIQNADDDELVGSYSSHDILIATSHAEGFGLPIVEAMQYGCQILASDIPVFREVAGNSASVQYFEPNSKESLKEKILAAALTAPSSQTGAPPSWVNWEQSAAKLVDVIINDNWYAEYIPSGVDSNPPELIGQIHVTKILSRDETKHRLEIIGPATFSNSGKTLKFTVKVTNDSQELFSSRGDPEGKLGIYLGYHIADVNGDRLRREYPRSAIPFVIPAGGSVYLPVDVDLNSLPFRAAFIDFEMVQEGAGWWGNPLRVALGA